MIDPFFNSKTLVKISKKGYLHFGKISILVCGSLIRYFSISQSIFHLSIRQPVNHYTT